MHKAITLIGMSGTGKSTVGPLIAQRLGWKFFDVDSIMREKEGKLLGEVIKEKGKRYIIDLEATIVGNLDLHEVVLDTPGSIIYAANCHGQIKKQTRVIWLKSSLATLIERFDRDPIKKGAIVGVEAGFEALYLERQPLYAKLADETILCDGKSPQGIADEIAVDYIS